jgi:hypothetical protein
MGAALSLRSDREAGPATATETKRVIYFRGHKDQESPSVLVCQLCKGYETVSASLQGESALRTLLNLYNLYAVRGALNDDALVFSTSMSGPHHYFGFIDATRHHVIVPDSNGLLVYREAAAPSSRPALSPVPAAQVLRIADYEWLPGATLPSATRAAYAVRDELATRLVDTAQDSSSVAPADPPGQADSLFDSPGILLLETPELRLPLLLQPHLCDLSLFRAQVVPNTAPFAFDPTLVAAHAHARHRLRVVTYNYGDDYVADYLMRGSGLFIERHEFIQAITPLTPECGGFVMLGREARAGDSAGGGDSGSSTPGGAGVLELVACPVPWGYTLLVDVGSIHGDSTLTGLYMMAMTGNHVAMRTADTVFLKHRATRANVRVCTDPALPPVPGLGGDRFLLSSDRRPLPALREANDALIRGITASLSPAAALWWKPVVTTPGAALGWSKTLAAFPQATQAGSAAAVTSGTAGGV